MKKVLAWFIIFSILLCAFSFSVSAENKGLPISQTIQASDGSSIIYFEDGSFIKITPVYINESSVLTFSISKTVSGYKIASYTDADGSLEWEYKLSATFSYVSGTSSICTNVSYNQTIYGSGYTFSDGAATKSGNVAQGVGKFVKKVLFITIATYEIDILITCDTYGNIHMVI